MWKAYDSYTQANSIENCHFLKDQNVSILKSEAIKVKIFGGIGGTGG